MGWPRRNIHTVGGHRSHLLFCTLRHSFSSPLPSVATTSVEKYGKMWKRSIQNQPVLKPAMSCHSSPVFSGGPGQSCSAEWNLWWLVGQYEQEHWQHIVRLWNHIKMMAVRKTCLNMLLINVHICKRGRLLIVAACSITVLVLRSCGVSHLPWPGRNQVKSRNVCLTLLNPNVVFNFLLM